MGKIEYFTIILNKPNPIYFSGEPLVGTVNIRISERLKINCVKMVINGSARVHWTESHQSGKNRTTRHYTAVENYLSFNVVFVAKQGNNDLYLEPGDYSYPFNIVLPPNLPTSFEHNFGRVRYSIYGTIDIPWAFDKHTTKSFTIVSPLDLNASPNLRQPYGVSATKVLCCGPCKSDPITANFSVKKGGYVPGEAVVFSVNIDNKSSREIKTMQVDLVQQISFHGTWHAHRKTRTTTRHVASIPFPGKIVARNQENWENISLLVPPVCSSSNGTCRIIDVRYAINLNFDAGGLAISKDLTIPIVIGTIPLMNMGLPLSGSNLPPLSYQASIFDPTPNQEMPPDYETKGEVVESDENSFRPSYPYYKDFSLTQPSK